VLTIGADRYDGAGHWRLIQVMLQPCEAGLNDHRRSNALLASAFQLAALGNGSIRAVGGYRFI